MALEGPRLDGLRSAVRRAADELAARPGVTHVTLGEKIREGTGTGQRSLKVHVLEKHVFAPGDRIAPVLRLVGPGGRTGEILTDVIAVAAPPALFATRSGDTIEAFDPNRGIVTLALTKEAKSYVLTNAHVAANLALGGATGPMRYWDPATRRWLHLGDVIRLSPMAKGKPITADLAVVRVESAVVDHHAIGPQGARLDRVDVMRAEVLSHWFWTHRKNLCGKAERLPNDVTVKADGVSLRYRGVWQVPVIDGQALPGISGALLCRTFGNLTVGCGQVFGGIEPGQHFANGAVWVFPFKPIIDTLWPTLPG
ncbi:MAG: hypothetical protein B7Z08_12405 [Sphingomonadales bacterium 32-68-7]|nr:MAG: hypothetical protein B7Z33_00050 [Sphingomonadales bacterium 12-68-11]OYX07416.1 MAG: hypothetical protein B7Z08_12405 [Sphingomonadales bacterium 32-68-7]